MSNFFQEFFAKYAEEFEQQKYVKIQRRLEKQEWNCFNWRYTITQNIEKIKKTERTMYIFFVLSMLFWIISIVLKE